MINVSAISFQVDASARQRLVPQLLLDYGQRRPRVKQMVCDAMAERMNPLSWSEPDLRLLSGSVEDY